MGTTATHVTLVTVVVCMTVCLGGGPLVRLFTHPLTQGFASNRVQLAEDYSLANLNCLVVKTFGQPVPGPGCQCHQNAVA